ncbi:MAG: hypothetical protein EOR30_34360 [Mesorhizobium sp.]|nr:MULTISPECIES: hypothetical protein [unclassified Mesorhizobium]RUV66741.1 hypothetical protein EOA78_33000 [Mesorhizobium sp. M5C.F.Cr.IN.023.01.1.1]RWF80808.1 MAG: hypothetical protein EOQ36_32055 [Mesorhizobium sp.]RWF88402.1 MAG: hypothetical protein EOQ45_32330 [Mesorhizobium sp.]RWI46027.1 MAG: hypothetical protein EOR16_35925 [Mesorhizobium sp.]RWI61374.1 MAG: hypothetical protein EOR17_34770 [Mesorhizobium sp.]
MAVLLANFQHKLVGDTEPGELFRIRFRTGFAICVNIEPANGGLVRLAVLQGTDIRHPTFLSSEAAKPCMSYGTAWAIEPTIGDESFPATECGNMATLYIGNELAALRLDPPTAASDFDCFHIDLVNGGSVELNGAFVPSARWKIWAVEDDRNRPGAKPIVEFGEPAAA